MLIKAARQPFVIGGSQRILTDELWKPEGIEPVKIEPEFVRRAHLHGRKSKDIRGFICAGGIFNGRRIGGKSADLVVPRSPFGIGNPNGEQWIILWRFSKDL